MWKNLLDKSKCLLGFHEGPWHYQRANSCTQSQKCERCGKEAERVEHRWGEWAYQAEHHCDLVRTCARCSQTETNLTHSWAEPTYVHADSCDRIAVCARCGEKERREPAHVLDAWSYRADDACTQVQACSRCGQAGSATRLQHDWDEWIQSGFYASRVRVCRHCGDMLVAESASSGGAAVSMQAIEADVNRLIAAQTAPQIRSVVTGSATLLTPVTEKYFQFAFDQYPDNDFRSGPLANARVVVNRCREIGVDVALQECGIEPPPAPAPSPSSARPPRSTDARQPAPVSGSLDRRLFGHWRSTEILGAGTSMSMPIDTHCVLDESGRFQFGSSRVESGTWVASGKELTLSFQGGDSLVRDYIIDGNSMVWPRDGRYRLWQRTG